MNMIEQKEYDRMRRELAYKDSVIENLQKRVKELEEESKVDYYLNFVTNGYQKKAQ